MAATVEEPRKQRRARVAGAGLPRRTFALDVVACPRCGGRRKVLAYVTASAGVCSILEHLELATQALKRAPAQAMGCEPDCSRYPHPVPLPEGEG